MNAKAALSQVVELGSMVMHAYVDDLTDAELMVRSVPGTNHIAWQLGHLIVATQHMIAELGQPAPKLPDGFAEAYTAETAALDDGTRFASKAKYLELADQMKAAAIRAIQATPDSVLDQPGPESMRAYAPTMGAVLALLGGHWLMHIGQFVPIRRRLGKPHLF